jgi:hypothetical protein
MRARHTGAGAGSRRLLQAGLVLAVAGLAWWSLTFPGFRDVEGFLTADVVLPGAVSLALLALAWTELGKWNRAGRWLALLLVGQGAALVLISAPNGVLYQHFRLDPLTPTRLAALGILALQLLWVGMALAPRLRAILDWARVTLGIPAAILVAFFVVLTSAALSRDLVQYAGELAFATAVQLLNLATVICLCAALPRPGLEAFEARLDRLEEGLPPGGTGGGLDRFALVLAAFVVVIGALLAVLVYERHPHVPDEVGYLLHAKYLAGGMLSMPLPPVPEAFDVDLMDFDGSRWFSPVPPGWPFVLALGQLAGVPWLVNPILAGICVLLASGVLAELYPARTRRLALLLLATSPWFLFMSMNFMNHQASLACALAATWLVAQARRRDRARLALMLAGGAFIGLLSLVRPLEAVAVALLLGLWSLTMRSGFFRLAPSVALVVGTLATGLLSRPYNAFMTGSPSYHPIMAYFDKHYASGANNLGFGPNRGLGWVGLDPFPGHGPLDVAVNAALNLFAINVELLGWATGSLLLIALLAASRRLQRSDWLMAAAISMIAGIHSFYWFSGGPDFGARYWYLVILPGVALTARGAEVLAASLATRVTAARERTAVGVLACVLTSLLLFVPWRSVSKYHNYRLMRPDIRALAERYQFGRSLVLVSGKRHPDFDSAVIYNPLDLSADTTVYAWDASPAARERVVLHYADRHIWLVDGPTMTGGAFRVRAGPLTADQVLALEFRGAPPPR